MQEYQVRSSAMQAQEAHRGLTFIATGDDAKQEGDNGQEHTRIPLLQQVCLRPTALTMKPIGHLQAWTTRIPPPRPEVEA